MWRYKSTDHALTSFRFISKEYDSRFGCDKLRNLHKVERARVQSSRVSVNMNKWMGVDHVNKPLGKIPRFSFDEPVQCHQRILIFVTQSGPVYIVLPMGS